MKKILIINGHPDPESYSAALTDAYVNGATTSGADVQIINIRDLVFDPNLAYGYRKRTELEPDLVRAQEAIKWADHLVWIYPVWWGSYPAIMKGFLDRVLLPGFAFQKREGSLWWDKYITAKSARIISTLDQPAWFFKWINGNTSNIAMRKTTLKFIGVKKVRTTTIGPIRLSKVDYRKKWLQKIETLGRKNV